MTDNPESQSWSAERYERNAGFVADLGEPLLDLLAAEPGEHILDLGCGDGRLSLRIAESGARVVGVDAAPDMVAAARARGIDARVMSGEALTFQDAFDAVLHELPRFFDDPTPGHHARTLKSVNLAIRAAQHTLQAWYAVPDERHRMQRIVGCLHFMRSALLDKDAPFNRHRH